jgi:hypothetical protein
MKKDSRPGLLFLHGAAGEGKSFFAAGCRDCRTVALKEEMENPPVTLEADLIAKKAGVDSNVTFLPGNVKRAVEIVKEAKQKPVLTMLDGLDEIAPSAAAAILKELVQWAQNPPTFARGRYARIVVAGRSEAFGSYIRDGASRPDLGFRILHFRGPRAANEAEVRARLDSVQKKYPDKSCPKGNDLVRLVRDDPALCQSLGNLALSKNLVESTEQLLGFATGNNEADRKKVVGERRRWLLDSLLRRNQKLGRPPPNDADYRTALRDFLLSDGVKIHEGGFMVASGTVVAYGDRGSVAVETLVNRSHVVVPDPADTNLLTYSFSPAWAGEVLLQERLEQHKCLSE